jgi:hypothetical protein
MNRIDHYSKSAKCPSIPKLQVCQNSRSAKRARLPNVQVCQDSESAKCSSLPNVQVGQNSKSAEHLSLSKHRVCRISRSARSARRRNMQARQDFKSARNPSLSTDGRAEAPGRRAMAIGSARRTLGAWLGRDFVSRRTRSRLGESAIQFVLNRKIGWGQIHQIPGPNMYQ